MITGTEISSVEEIEGMIMKSLEEFPAPQYLSTFKSFAKMEQKRVAQERRKEKDLPTENMSKFNIAAETTAKELTDIDQLVVRAINNLIRNNKIEMYPFGQYLGIKKRK